MSWRPRGFLHPESLSTKRVLAAAAIGLTVVLAFVLGFVILDDDGSHETLPAQADSADEGREELIRLAGEASAEAQAAVPGAALYLVAYAGGSGLYTFRFVEPDESGDVVLVGPYAEAGRPRWEVTRQRLPEGTGRLAPLDTSSLKKGPAGVIEAAASEVGYDRSGISALVAVGPGPGEPI